MLGIAWVAMATGPRTLAADRSVYPYGLWLRVATTINYINFSGRIPQKEGILKAKEMEAEGIDPPTSRMRSGRSTI